MRKAKVTIWKGESRSQHDHYFDAWWMWRGVCMCGKEWQFHFFGATLGYGLEHLRRGCK